MLTMRYVGKKVFKLKRPLGKVPVCKDYKAKVQKEQLIAKEEIKVFG